MKIDPHFGTGVAFPLALGRDTPHLLFSKSFGQGLVPIEYDLLP
jgi:hypothetical protein